MATETPGVDAEAKLLSKQVGSRIAELRRLRGWSQKEFAYKLNSSIQWVSTLETGKQNLQLHTLVRLSRLLDVEVVSLLQPAGPEPPGTKRGRPRKDG